jgi:hypothetical protein
MQVDSAWMKMLDSISFRRPVFSGDPSECHIESGTRLVALLGLHVRPQQVEQILLELQLRSNATAPLRFPDSHVNPSGGHCDIAKD